MEMEQAKKEAQQAKKEAKAAKKLLLEQVE
jgi:hypothetical protein